MTPMRKVDTDIDNVDRYAYIHYWRLAMMLALENGINRDLE